VLVEDVPGLLEILYELNDYQRGATPELARILGTNPSLLNKILRGGHIDTSIAVAVADRILTHLKSQREYTATVEGSDDDTDVIIPSPPPKEFTVRAVEWKVLVQTDELEDNINDVVRLIGEVIEHANTSNLPPDERALTEIERAQLIAVLETALAILKTPMIEIGLLKKAATMLKRAAAKAVEKQVENAFAFTAGFAAGKISNFLPHL